MKTSQKKLYEVMYVSTMAPDLPLSVVGEIAAHARLSNAALDITGVLIFDGARFCQQIEGYQKDVVALMELIYQDSRHCNVEMFHHGPLAERRFGHFSMAFSNTDDVAVLEKLEKLEGQPGVDALMALVEALPLQA